MHRHCLDKENIHLISSRVGANSNVCHSESHNSNAAGELKRAKVSLLEKDRQLTNLEQQLSIANSRVESLTSTAERHRRAEQASKRLVTENKTAKRRPCVANKLSNFQSDALKCGKRADISGHRKSLEKKELLEELEKLGEQI